MGKGVTEKVTPLVFTKISDRIKILKKDHLVLVWSLLEPVCHLTEKGRPLPPYTLWSPKLKIGVKGEIPSKGIV